VVGAIGAKENSLKGVLKIATRNDKNSIAINNISGYTPTLLKIASRNDKNRNAKNNIAIDSISGYIPILICP